MSLINWVRNTFLEKNITLNDIATFSQSQSAIYCKLALEIAKNTIANAISKCDFRFYTNGIENSKSREFYRWNIKPNKNQNGVQFKQKIISKLIDDNEVLIFENGNELLVADGYSKSALNGAKEIIFESIEVDGVTIKKRLKRSDVCFIQLNNKNIKNISNQVTCSVAEALCYAINGYKNSNSNKWKYKITSLSSADPEFATKFNEIKSKQLEPFLKSENAVFPEFEGNELSQIENQNNKPSSAIIDLRKEAFTITANALKIPKSLMLGENIDDKVTLQFISDCVEPILNIIANEINSSMYSYDEFASGNKCDIDTSAISVTLISTIANGIEKLLSSGVMNIDEIRLTILHMAELNTEFSTKYWITKNFEEINIALKGGENDEK